MNQQETIPAKINTDIGLYECTFTHRATKMITHAERLCDLINGFWINERWELTKGGDSKFFVMPHMITEIDKIKSA